MVYHRDTAAVKYLLKEKGFLKGKGKQKPKAKKEISMKNVTNISTGQNSLVEDEDEFIIVIPSQFLKQNKSSPADSKINSNKNKGTDKKSVFKGSFTETCDTQKPKSYDKMQKSSSIKKDSKQNYSSINSKINLKSDNKSVYEDDCNDEFTIKISPEQLQSFYKNYDKVSVKSFSGYSSDKDLQSHGSSHIWNDYKMASKNTVKKVSSDDSSISPESNEEDDDEFIIPIPKYMCKALGN